MYNFRIYIATWFKMIFHITNHHSGSLYLQSLCRYIIKRNNPTTICSDFVSAAVSAVRQHPCFLSKFPSTTHCRTPTCFVIVSLVVKEYWCVAVRPQQHVPAAVRLLPLLPVTTHCYRSPLENKCHSLNSGFDVRFTSLELLLPQPLFFCFTTYSVELYF